jgi:hypothetical protein
MLRFLGAGILIVALLAACGGGGGSTTPTSPVVPPTKAPVTAPGTTSTPGTSTSQIIYRVETFRGWPGPPPRTGEVFFRLWFTDPKAMGFGFKGAKGAGWAEANFPFSSPSFGHVYLSPGGGTVEYPFNLACGTTAQYESDVEAWINDTASASTGKQHSQSVTIHLACNKPAPTSPPTYNAGSYAGKIGFISSIYNLPTTPADGVIGYMEPQGSQYWNYCGPGASRVLIAAWASIVPDIFTLGGPSLTNGGGPLGENTDLHHVGTYTTDMVGPINTAIDTVTGQPKPYYTASQVGRDTNLPGQGDFSTMIGQDILDNNHPSITGLQTTGGTQTMGNSGNLIGWGLNGGLNAAHIVTIFGFDFTSPSFGYIYYYETANPDAGAAFPGPHIIDYKTFWSLVTVNSNANSQIHGGPTAPVTASLAGDWSGTETNNVPTPETAPLYFTGITQNGSQFSGNWYNQYPSPFNSAYGTLSGTVTGNTFTAQLITPILTTCTGTYNGTISADGSTISGSWSQNPPYTGCNYSTQQSGNFNLTKGLTPMALPQSRSIQRNSGQPVKVLL